MNASRGFRSASDREQHVQTMIRRIALMYYIMEEHVFVPRLSVLRVKYPSSVRCMLAKDFVDFQRHFRVSRRVFDHIIGVIKRDVEIK